MWIVVMPKDFLKFLHTAWILFPGGKMFPLQYVVCVLLS